MKIRTELLEYLIRQCVVEVLDQIEEEADASNLKSSGIGKGDDVKPVKQTVTVNPFRKGKGFKKNIKKLDESENPELGGDVAPPQGGQGTGDQPAVPKDEPKPEEPKPEEPNPEEQPQRIPKGAVLLNPKDKSKLQPIKFQGRDEFSIERTLHQVAVSISGPRTLVSLGAKRMAREVISNPNSTVYFYIGKMDPESDEVFLMADKSLKIAKDNSVQPTGVSLSTPSPTLNYGNMTDDQYTTHMNSRDKAKPRHGIDEGASNLIKKMVNNILDS